ncbi:serine hydrolase [Flavobacterium sp.]|uniref:serine hydrolase n=1 Tax=Flavobacterium sp. TaxID=239 RepID=UPI0031DA3B8D
MIKLFFLIVWTFSSFLNVFAQEKSVRIDSLLQSAVQRGMFNGVLLAAQDGRIMYEKAFGYADFGQKKANTIQTGFELASVSKVFTAVAILQLKDKGKLKFDDPFSLYYPDFPYKTVTIRQLLSHTSGISDQDIESQKAEIPFKDTYTNQELVTFLSQHTFKFKLSPNEKWWYSNTGYALLAALVEKLSGKTFDVYLQKEIFKKAGMTHTYLKSDFLNTKPNFPEAFNYDYPKRYISEREKMEGSKSYYHTASYGASNVVSTVNDLLLFDNALYNTTLVNQSTLKEAYQSTILKNGEKNYVWINIGGMGKAYDGLGWFLFDDESAGKTVWHTGGMPGCVTILLRNVEKKQTVVLLDNVNSEGVYLTAFNTLNILNNQPLLPVRKSFAKAYGKILMKDGDEAADLFLIENRTRKNLYSISENDLNNLGYDFLSDKLYSQALKVFKTNIVLFPESDNTYNSYGEALYKIGKKDEALQMFRKSLEINPENEDSIKAIEDFTK